MIEHVYFTSQGEVAKAILDGVAAFFNSGAGNIFYWVTGMIGTFATVCRLLMRQELRQMFLWLGAFTVMLTALTEGKRSVVIHEQARPLATFHVDNVPLGLALPLTAVTGLSSYLTDRLEGIMHIPHDLSYEKNGMIWGATLYSQLKETRVNTELLNYFARFIARCVWLDVNIRHKYTLKELAAQPDVLDFLKQKTKMKDGYARVHIPGANPGEPGAEDFPRCGDALLWLERKFKDEALLNIEAIAKFDANALTKQLVLVKQGIEHTYNHFFNLSSSAQNILMQNLAMNAIRDGFKTIAVSKNSPAASSLNYVKTQGQMARTSSWMSLGIAAQEYVPMMHTVLMLLLCCAFIPIVYMAFFPNYTLPIISKYLGGFIYFGTWPMFFVFINFIMNTILSVHLKSYTGDLGGLTLSNMDAVEALTWRYAALTGYLLAAVPYLARMLMIGAGSAVMGVSSGMMQQASQDAEKGAKGMSEGSFRIGELSVANASMNNIAANHHDMQPRELAFGAMRQSISGGMQNQSASGHITYDNTGMIDKQPFDMFSRETVAAGFAKTQAMHEGNSVAFMQMSQEQEVAGLNKALAASKQGRYDSILQNSQSSDELVEVARSAQTMASIVEKHGIDNVIATRRALGGEFNIGGALSVFGAKGSLSGERSKTDNYSHGLSADEIKQFNEAEKIVTNAKQSVQQQFNEQLGVSDQDSLVSNLQQSKSYQESAQRSHNLAEEAAQNVNYAKQHDLTLNQNVMPEFKQYLESNYGAAKASGWLGDVNQQKNPEFLEAQSNFIKDTDTRALSWYNKHSTDLKAEASGKIAQQSSELESEKSNTHSEYEKNQAWVQREATINRNNAEMDRLKASGYALQSTITPVEHAERSVNETLNNWGLHTSNISTQNPPQNVAMKSPDMSALNKRENIEAKQQGIMNNSAHIRQQYREEQDKGLTFGALSAIGGAWDHTQVMIYTGIEKRLNRIEATPENERTERDMKFYQNNVGMRETELYQKYQNSIVKDAAINPNQHISSSENKTSTDFSGVMGAYRAKLAEGAANKIHTIEEKSPESRSEKENKYLQNWKPLVEDYRAYQNQAKENTVQVNKAKK